MLKKLKFFFIGLVPGLAIVFFVLNKKGASCSGYLPNSRVIAETLSKDFQYNPEVESEMKRLNINEKFLKDSILTNGEIDFDKSSAQKKPCPEYLLNSKKSVYQIEFQKCNEQVTFTSFKKMK